VTPNEEKETDDVSGPATPPGIGIAAPGEAVEEGADELETSAPDPDAVADPPAEVAELAAACVRFTTARYGVMPDFTPDTLSLVDQWLRDARREIEERPETVQVVQAAAGAYLGEVVRRAFGARWVTGEDHAGWLLCMSTVYCAFNPIGMAREALMLDAAEGWHAHFELDPGEKDLIEARLAALPEVADEDFYSPSTRFDVVNIVVDALREHMRSSGLGDVRFTPQDYEGEST
jgi:Family of unknown function (DUF6278)